MSRRHFAAALLILLSGAPAIAHAQVTSPSPVPRTGVSPDEWASRAREFARKGSLFEALESFDHAVAVDPSRDDIRLEYASLLKTAGFWLRSAEQYRRLLAGRPDHVATIIGYGELLNAEYQFAAAAPQFQKAIALSADVHDRERATVGLGVAQHGLEDFAASARTFETLLAERPDVMSALAFLAIAKRSLGRLEESLALWNRFLEAQPGASRARIHRIELEELLSAIEQTRASVQQEPANAAAWARLGRLLRRKHDLAGAAEAFSAAVRLEPRQGAHHFLLGAVQRDLGRWRDAAASFASVGPDPVYGTLALYNLADSARRQGDAAAEAKAWGEVCARHPWDMYAYRKKAAALRASGGLELETARVKEAARAAAGAPGTAPRDPLPMVRLAIVHQAAGETGSARQAALDALRSDPCDVNAQAIVRLMRTADPSAADAMLEMVRPGQQGPDGRLRGALLLALGRAKDAETELRRVAGAGTADAAALVSLATAVRSQGRAEEAIGLLEQARGRSPDYLYAHLDLAVVLLDAGRTDEAIAAAREALRIAPEYPIGYSILGSALRLKGDHERAARALEQAVAMDPMDATGAPRLLLVRVYGALGRYDEAREALTGDLPQDPQEVYRMAWEFVRDTYNDRKFRGQDWSAWEHRFDGKLSTMPEALSAIALMLSSLDDRNTRLRSAQQTASLVLSPRMDAAEFSQATGAALSTSRTLETRRLEDNIGYIAITNLDDPRLPAEMQKAVDQMKTSDGVILDLRGNQGGGDADVPRIAGMFVEPGSSTGKIVSPEGTVTAKAEKPVKGDTPVIPGDRPVVVLVDHNTASSAENLAGSLKESRRAILVGENTHGKSGIQLPRLLPGGAIVLVVGAEHADLSGRIYTGVGIRPDVPVEDASRGDRAGADPALSKARELVRKRKVGPKVGP